MAVAAGVIGLITCLWAKKKGETKIKKAYVLIRIFNIPTRLWGGTGGDGLK